MMRHGSNNIHAFCLGGVLGYRSPVSLVGAEWRSPVWLVPHWIPPPAPPSRSDEPSRFILLEREVEQEYRPLMLERLQHKVNEVAKQARATTPACPRCGQWKKGSSGRSRLAFCYCHRSAWNLRPDAGRWSVDSSSLAWGTRTRLSGACMGNSESWDGSALTPSW